MKHTHAPPRPLVPVAGSPAPDVRAAVRVLGESASPRGGAWCLGRVMLYKVQSKVCFESGALSPATRHASQRRARAALNVCAVSRLIIADDLTGAADSALEFAKGGNASTIFFDTVSRVPQSRFKRSWRSWSFAQQRGRWLVVRRPGDADPSSQQCVCGCGCVRVRACACGQGGARRAHAFSWSGLDAGSAACPGQTSILDADVAVAACSTESRGMAPDVGSAHCDQIRARAPGAAPPTPHPSARAHADAHVPHECTRALGFPWPRFAARAACAGCAVHGTTRCGISMVRMKNPKTTPPSALL